MTRAKRVEKEISRQQHREADLQRNRLKDRQMEIEAVKGEGSWRRHEQMERKKGYKRMGMRKWKREKAEKNMNRL